MIEHIPDLLNAGIDSYKIEGRMKTALYVATVARTYRKAIDDYLETCKAEGKEPEVAFKGSFNIRLSPDLHKKLFIYATAHQMSMNKYIEDTLKNSPAARVVI